MLAARVATALVLLAVLLPTLFAAPAPAWGVVTLAFLAVGAWEWTRMLPPPAPARTAAAVLALVGAALLAWRASHGWPPYLLEAGCALLGLFWSIGGGLRLRRHESRGGGWMLAAALLLGCWISLYELRLLGPVQLLSAMAVVWIADIAAYFAGRALGRRKLAPGISPGKTWEGAAGGAIAVAVIGVLAGGWPPASASLPALLLREAGVVATVAALVGLAALSIVGDLHESLLKRQAGVKDSGWILPGHGGVLDRIDALIPVMPVTLLLYRWLG